MQIRKNDIWIVIPAFNEDRYLAKVLQKIRKQHERVIVVSDGSTDRTSEIAKSEKVHLLEHRINLGKGAAIKTGCDYAFGVLKAKAVILMDADDQHDAAEIQKFTSKILDGSELIFGVRDIYTSMPFFKKLANLGLSHLVSILFGSFVPDIPSGFRGISKNVWKKLDCQATGYEIETEMAVKVAKEKINFDTVCITTIYHDMNKGMTFLDALKLISPIINWRLDI